MAWRDSSPITSCPGVPAARNRLATVRLLRDLSVSLVAVLASDHRHGSVLRDPDAAALAAASNAQTAAYAAADDRATASAEWSSENPVLAVGPSRLLRTRVSCGGPIDEGAPGLQRDP